jgi:mycothiol synthase
MAQSWFDAEGFFVAWEGNTLVGSCWTKLHDGGVGEIYIIGVLPGWEGRGLGRALVALGLGYLARSKDATEAMLYVESVNEAATKLYQSLGFEVTGTVAAYRSTPNN